MLPNSRPQQHHATHFPSIIRTRSQQQHPLAPVDVYASPFRAALRNHDHSHNLNTTGQTSPGHKAMGMISQDVGAGMNWEDNPFTPHKKRAISPSLAGDGHTGKRPRVLCQSSKINSPMSREYLATLRKEMPTTRTSPEPTRVVTYASPSKADRLHIPTSPVKPCSPMKTFQITNEDGLTMRVPVTPRRSIANVVKVHSPAAQTSIHPSTAPILPTTHSSPHSSVPPAPMQPSTLISVLPKISSPFRSEVTSSVLESKDDIKDVRSVDITSSSSPHKWVQTTTTPIRSKFLTTNVLTGNSPLTPLPPTSHPRRSTDTKPLLTSGTVVNAIHASPTKSRIPIPASSSFSRVHKPCYPSLPVLPVATPSGPIKPSTHHTPIKSKYRLKGKVKSGLRPRLPVTRLAAKRGLRKSLLPSTGPRAEPLLDLDVISFTELAGSSNTTTVSRVNKEIGELDRLRPKSPSGSPKKPTPLSALSTALQKLQTIPPAPPLPRPRPSVNTEFSLTLTQNSSFKGQDDISIESKTPGGATMNPTGMQKSNMSQGNAHRGLGKIGLPLRRPTSAARVSSLWMGAPLASKQTTLSTVQSSPAPSTPRKSNASSVTHDVHAEVVDADAWSSSGKREETVKAEANKEYFEPLVDEPRTNQHPSLVLISPSRRASQASIALSHSLSLPSAPTISVPARSVSANLRLNPRTPVRTRNKTKPPMQPASMEDHVAKPDDPMGGKRSNARMPGSLNVLRDCIIFVDVRTEEGEDAAALFVDMLRGLGARILSKPGKSCTHLVYKAGLPSTITKYKLLPEPRPLVVSIGWVVECVERRAKVEETRFLVNLDEAGVAGGAQRQRSMQPKQMRTVTLGQLENGEPADISVRADSSFTSEEPSALGPFLANLSPRAPNNNSLPPLERARQRSLRLP